MTFNLVDDPWIVVRTTDGHEVTVGLRELFHRAQHIAHIRGDLPTQDFAVFRIALAVYYRAVLEQRGGDYNAVDVESLWHDGPPAAEIDQYLDRWHDRLELFHPEHPFLQVPDLHLAGGDVRGLELLVPDSPGRGSLFTMRQAVESLDNAAAARWLVHCQAFDFSGIKSGAVGDDRVKGGKGYPIGIGWAGWLGGLMVEGANLAETLLHNFTAPKEPDARDAAIWELAPLTASDRSVREIGPFGPLGLFTWPIRRIRLFRNDNRVNGVLICNGDPIEYWRQHTNEPMSAWRLSDTQRKKHKSTTAIYMPLAHDPSRALWRGLSRLLPAGQGATRDKNDDQINLAPATLDALAYRVATGLIPEQADVRTTAVGMEYGAQMSSYREVFSDALRFHPRVADPTSLSHEIVISALARADGAARAVGTLSGDLAVAGGGERQPSDDDARGRAYDALDHLFREWLPEVEEANAEQRLTQWTQGAREVIVALAEEFCADAPPSARALRARDGRLVSVGTAQNRFRYNLNQHLPSGPDAEQPQPAEGVPHE